MTKEEAVERVVLGLSWQGPHIDYFEAAEFLGLCQRESRVRETCFVFPSTPEDRANYGEEYTQRIYRFRYTDGGYLGQLLRTYRESFDGPVQVEVFNP